MKESLIQPISVQALRGVNQSPSERPDEFATLQNVAPDEVGRMTRVLGKKTIEKVDGPVMGIFQFWNAYGYGSRLRQTTGGVISDPEVPDDPGFKQPIDDEPLNCRPVKPYSNKLKIQYIDRRSDFIQLRYNWTRCSGTDFDSRTSLVACSIAGVPVFDGTLKQAIVGYFHDGPVLDFNHAGKNILSLAADNSYPYESVVVNLWSLRELAGSGVALTAKFQLKGYFFSYISQGNVMVYFDPKERGKSGTYERKTSGGNTGFIFPRCSNYVKKSWKANIVTQTATPTLTTGDHICYLYVSFAAGSQQKKDRIWIDDV